MTLRRGALAGALLPVLLASLAVSPALAAPPPGAAKGAPLAKDDPDWLGQCRKEAEANGEGNELGWAHCMVEHREALVAAQKELVTRIDKELAAKGPEGTDYKAAAASLAQAQQHWEAFVAADCGIIDDVFGYGTAEGLAGEDCVIDHYRTRNDDLRALEENYLGN